MRKRCGVIRRRWQAAQGSRQRFRGNGCELCQLLALNEFRKNRGASNGSRAAPAEKTDLANNLILDASGQPENIAADRIACFDARIGRGKFTGIPRILEMIEERLGEHERIMAAPTRPCN